MILCIEPNTMPFNLSAENTTLGSIDDVMGYCNLNVCQYNAHHSMQTAHLKNQIKTLYQSSNIRSGWSFGLWSFYFCAMYTKQEASELRRTFWTVFGQYMSPVLSADGEKVTWMNYKTGEKNIYFKMEADEQRAIISIELSHQEPGLQQVYFNQFKAQEVLLETALNETWQRELCGCNESGKTISRIYKELPQVSIFKKEDWPLLISFFKPRIIALDNFWSNARYGFKMLH